MNLIRSDEAAPGVSSFTALANLDQAALDALPEAVYLCAGDGRVIRCNRRAIELWGRTPKLGDAEERFCGSFRLYGTDGTRLPHDQCPTAVALETGLACHDEEVVVEQPGGRRLTVRVNIAALKDAKGRVDGAINCFQDITERKRAEERQRQLVEEFKHRIKNTLATVQSMAAHTARNATSIEKFLSCFQSRLLAFAQAHVVLGEGEWRSARLRDLIERQLEFFAGQGEDWPRIRLAGPEVALQPQLALSLSLMFHELTTNAVKYGALSVAEGQVSVEWDLPSGAEDTLTLRWTETGGPPVEAPQRTGFGTRLINGITEGLGGHSRMRFERSGLQLLASIPLRA